MLKVSHKQDNVIYIENQKQDILEVIEQVIFDDVFDYSETVSDNLLSVEDQEIEQLFVNNQYEVPNEVLTAFLNIIQKRSIFLDLEYNPIKNTKTKITISCTVPCRGTNVVYSPVLSNQFEKGGEVVLL